MYIEPVVTQLYCQPPAASPVPNPFFGTLNLKKGIPVNVKDDFNPFRHGKVTDAKTVSEYFRRTKFPLFWFINRLAAAQWPYTGKRYLALFPAPTTVSAPPPQASPHMQPHGPPPPPPPSYDEDAAAQAQAAASRGGYIYYAPYYPGQVRDVDLGFDAPGVTEPFLAPSTSYAANGRHATWCFYSDAVYATHALPS